MGAAAARASRPAVVAQRLRPPRRWRSGGRNARRNFGDTDPARFAVMRERLGERRARPDRGHFPHLPGLRPPQYPAHSRSTVCALETTDAGETGRAVRSSPIRRPRSGRTLGLREDHARQRGVARGRNRRARDLRCVHVSGFSRPFQARSNRRSSVDATSRAQTSVAEAHRRHATLRRSVTSPRAPESTRGGQLTHDGLLARSENAENRSAS
jgi:hypothetical protein